jgi:hypothetical protein
MHGVVNQAIEGLIIERFGKDKWEEILIAANCQNSTFYNNQNYPDSTTYDLAINASKILNMNLTIFYSSLVNIGCLPLPNRNTKFCCVRQVMIYLNF